MSSSKDQRPASFGDRFREEGLSGILQKKPKKSKSDPNEMHFLEHLEELRWVILKSVVAFLVGCIGVAIFMQDSVKLLQMPLIKAVEDFGEIRIDLQSIGLEQYTKSLEKREIGLGELRIAKEQDLTSWGITDPHHQNRIINHFAKGSNRNLLQVIRSYSPIFIAMKICFLGGIGLSLPMILYFVGSFVVPGLTLQEKKVFFPGCIAATFLFLAGAAMTYFFILPPIPCLHDRIFFQCFGTRCLPSRSWKLLQHRDLDDLCRRHCFSISPYPDFTYTNWNSIS